jgi:hypothetical protein
VGCDWAMRLLADGVSRTVCFLPDLPNTKGDLPDLVLNRANGHLQRGRLITGLQADYRKLQKCTRFNDIHAIQIKNI